MSDECYIIYSCNSGEYAGEYDPRRGEVQDWDCFFVSDPVASLDGSVYTFEGRIFDNAKFETKEACREAAEKIKESLLSEGFGDTLEIQKVQFGKLQLTFGGEVLSVTETFKILDTVDSLTFSLAENVAKSKGASKIKGIIGNAVDPEEIDALCLRIAEELGLK